MRTQLSCLGLLLLTAALAVAEDPKPHVDEDHRFRINPMGARWRILNERDIKKVVPDACAGAVGPRGCYGVVIVEDAGSATPEVYARLLIENMPLEGKQSVAPRRVTFAGQQAIRYEVTGRMKGMELVYINHLFVRDGYLFQVLGWGLKASDPREHLKAFFDAFDTLPGTVRGRVQSLEAVDAEGPGWRVRGGVFESAPFRLRVAKTPGWRVVVGGELKNMNEEAEVGFLLGQPAAYGVLIAERASGVDQKTFIKHVSTHWGESITARAVGTPTPYMVAGHKVSTQRFLMDGDVPFEFLRGAFFAGETCYQFQFWYLASLSDGVRSRLPELLGSIRILTAGAADQMSAAMAREPDAQNSVGRDFALRRGVYRDFKHGLKIVKPKNRDWRFEVGQQARVINPDAALAFVDPSSGIQGILILDELEEGEDAATYHHSVLEGMFGAEHPSLTETPETAPMRGATGRWSSVEEVSDPLRFTHRVTTAVRGTLGVQILMWGLAGNMRDAASIRTWAELIAGVEFHKPKPAFHERDGEATDLRLGYRVRPGARLGASRDIAPTSLAPMSTVRIWTRRGRTVLVCGLCGMDAGHDSAWFRDLMQRILDRHMAARGSTRSTAPSKLGGIDVERVIVRSADEQSHAWLVTRDRSFFAVCAIGADDLDDQWFEDIRASFEFVD